MSPPRHDLRLLPAAVGTWAVALAATLMPAVAGAIAGGCWLAVISLLVWLARRRTGGVLLVAAAVAAVAASHVAWAVPSRADALAEASGRPVTVQVVITTKVEPAWAGAWRFSGDAVQVDGSFAAPVTVLFSGDRPADLDLGATAQVSGTTRAARPGERAVFVVLARGSPTVIAPPAGVLAVAAQLRTSFVAVATALPGSGAELLPGLAVGDTSAVPETLDRHMKMSSLSHLTAVSGSNCAIVVAAAFGIAALCRARRAVRVIVALVALAGFVLLVTPEPSVLRSAVMASGAMLALLLGRTRGGVGLLALTVAVLLAWDPWLALSMGFLLSVAATAALLTLAGPIADRWSAHIPKPVALAIAVPVAAQLACAPLLLVLDPAVSVYGVLANLIAAPAAPVSTVVGLVACLTAGIPIIGFALTCVAWVPAQWIAATAELCATLPAARLVWPAGPIGIVALTIVVAAISLLLVGTRPSILRPAAGAIVAVTVGVAVGTIGLGSVIAPLTVPDDWQVAACDIGQGDALVVRSGDDVALIDTGRDPAPLIECLTRLGVGQVDLFVLTHFDVDHSGALEALRGRVGTVLHGPVPPEHQHRIDALAQAGAQLVTVTAGMSGTLGDARWRVLWPTRTTTIPGNDASVVLDIRDGGLPTAVFLGDLSAAGQRALQANGLLRPPYTIVKVSHHGSADQEPTLYDRLRSSLALLSVGAGNEYGHPRQETLDLLTARGIRAARTDESGLLLVTLTDDGTLRLWQERGSP